MATSQNNVRPSYGPQPKGKANIMKQGQTESSNGTFGADPLAGSKTPECKDYPEL